ncbi:MAG TPA: hypothetical protein VHW23_28975 [Kofleriaceae bacterium]|jgi:hypothetical protein|nr:hypothetical protein [Kofleriaceae bacterium]
MNATTIAGATAALLYAALGGCSFVLDSSSKQCSVDADCSGPNHPVCQENVCVESGLGPDGCFFGQPAQQADFLNQCTTSNFFTFKNCDRLGLCNASQQLPKPTDAMTGTAPAPQPPAEPLNLCTAGAPTSGTGATPNMIWMTGSSDFGPLMHAAQPLLSAAATPYRAVFQNASSCAGVAAAFTGTVMKDPDPAKGNWAFYYDDGGNPVNCRIDAKGATVVGVPITLAISDLYATTCSTTTPPVTYTPSNTTVRDYTGPVVPFVFATKAASSEQSISAEAAHLVFGNGGNPQMLNGMKAVAPWTDYTQYYIRSNTAGSTVLTAKLIGLDKDKPFWGIDRASTDNLKDSLLAATNPDAALGILSIDFYDQNRGDLKALYLQSMGQTAGYLPDSKPTTVDKINVRDGHYGLWGYVHFIVPTDPAAGNTDINAAAKAIVLRLSASNLEQSLIDAIIKASEVPQCAMKVERSDEVGAFSTRNLFSCGCYFDVKTTGHTSCKTCGTSEDCADGGSCNYGYCEAH